MAYSSPYTNRINISVANELLDQIDCFVKSQGIRSRSEFFAHAARLYMSKALRCGMCGEIISGKHYCGDCLLSYSKERK